MKKFMFLISIMLVSGFAFAQGNGTETNGDYNQYWQSIGALAGLVALLTEALTNLFKVPEGSTVDLLFFKLKTAQLIALIVGIAGGLFGLIFELGIFAGYIWWQAGLIGLGSAFIANGFADTKFIKWALKLIGAYNRKTKLN